MKKRIHSKQPAPAFEASDQTGKRVRSADLKGRWVVLYFYPKDETTGCTQEACGFRDEFQGLRQEGAVVIGVSRDSTESHERFAANHNLPFALLADEEGKMQRAFGARGIFGITRRITFLIDPHGTVVKTYRVRRWRSHAAQVLDDLRQMKANGGPEDPPKTEV